MEFVFHPKKQRNFFPLPNIPKQRKTKEVCKFSGKLGEGFILVHSSVQLFFNFYSNW